MKKDKRTGPSHRLYPKMSDTENPDNFAEEIVETGVVRKTVKRSYIIQEVSIFNALFTCFMFM